VLFNTEDRVKVWFSVWLVSVYPPIVVILSVVIERNPILTGLHEESCMVLTICAFVTSFVPAHF